MIELHEVAQAISALHIRVFGRGRMYAMSSVDGRPSGIAHPRRLRRTFAQFWRDREHACRLPVTEDLAARLEQIRPWSDDPAPSIITIDEFSHPSSACGRRSSPSKKKKPEVLLRGLRRVWSGQLDEEFTQVCSIASHRCPRLARGLRQAAQGGSTHAMP
jgi:hypothetical protein